MTKRLVGVFLTLAIVFGAPSVIYISHRNGQMDRLYAEAAGYPQFFRGNAQSTEAVRALAKFRGERATALLVNIALGQGPFVGGDTQTEAIHSLATRGDSEIGKRLADLLQPFEGLETRSTVAKVLKDLPCNNECVRSVLHYLEEVWHGEPNYEDRWIIPPENEPVTLSHKKEQQVIYENLYIVLRREQPMTLTTLVTVYGLGTVAPSTFAINLSSRAGLTATCPLLVQSANSLRDVSPESYRAPRVEIETAITSLKCRAGNNP